jgi:hypothetical protein
MTPDLGVRACVRTLSPPNPDIFTAIPKDPFFYLSFTAKHLPLDFKHSCLPDFISFLECAKAMQGTVEITVSAFDGQL